MDIIPERHAEVPGSESAAQTREITKIRRQFIDWVLPCDGDGQYFVFSTDSGLVNGQKTWRDHHVDDLTQLRHQIDKHDAVGGNVYFALAKFDGTKAGGNRSRKAKFAGHLKSFFLDLDVGKPNNSYDNFAEAEGALDHFIMESGLPRPVIVRSGMGLHAYWPFDSEVSFEEWEPIAEQFKGILQASGMIIDPAVPADAARVLRLPWLHMARPQG